MDICLDTNQNISGYDLFGLIHNKANGSLCEQRYSFICLGHIHIGKHFTVKGLEVGLTVASSSSCIDVIPRTSTIVYHVDLIPIRIYGHSIRIIVLHAVLLRIQLRLQLLIPITLSFELLRSFKPLTICFLLPLLSLIRSTTLELGLAIRFVTLLLHITIALTSRRQDLFTLLNIGIIRVFGIDCFDQSKDLRIRSIQVMIDHRLTEVNCMEIHLGQICDSILFQLSSRGRNFLFRSLSLSLCSGLFGRSDLIFSGAKLLTALLHQLQSLVDDLDIRSILLHKSLRIRDLNVIEPDLKLGVGTRLLILLVLLLVPIQILDVLVL